MKRRKFVGLTGLGLAGMALDARSALVSRRRGTPDVLVIGAGVFGVWTAYHLRRQGATVTLVDAFGPGNAFGESGGHTRMTQIDGDSPLFIRSCLESFPWWERMDQSSYSRIIYRTGRLRLGKQPASLARAQLRKQQLLPFGVSNVEILDAAEMRHRWPAIRTDDMLFGSYHPGGPGGSALRADVGCKVVANEFEKMGGKVMIGHADAQQSRGRLRGVRIRETGERLQAAKYVFAGGPWMPSQFPELLGPRLRLEPRLVYFYKLPEGDERLAFPNIPAWTLPEASIYGVPSIENEGHKFAPGIMPASVPDIEQQTREFAYDRFPSLKGMPVLRVRACQMTRTVSYDFIIDRHPQLENAYLVCAGSGQGYKHGPTVGLHATKLLLGETLDAEYAAAFRLKNDLFDAPAPPPPADAARETYPQ